MSPARRHFLGIDPLSRDEIVGLLDAAAALARGAPGELLSGCVVAMWFVEPCETQGSAFEAAARGLGARVHVQPARSGGDHVRDPLRAGRELAEAGADAIVLRHPQPGAAHLLAGRIASSIVNAGDGLREDPVPALELATAIRSRLGSLEGRRVVLVGDLRSWGAARSAIALLSRSGAEVVSCGPPTLTPPGLEALGTRIEHAPERGLEGAEAVIAFTLGPEAIRRGQVPSEEEFVRLYAVTPERLGHGRQGCVVLSAGSGRPLAASEVETRDGDPDGNVGRPLAEAAAMAALAFVAGARP